MRFFLPAWRRKAQTIDGHDPAPITTTPGDLESGKWCEIELTRPPPAAPPPALRKRMSQRRLVVNTARELLNAKIKNEERRARRNKIIFRSLLLLCSLLLVAAQICIAEFPPPRKSRNTLGKELATASYIWTIFILYVRVVMGSDDWCFWIESLDSLVHVMIFVHFYSSMHWLFLYPLPE
ncbi:hypothetical protein IWX90DRAFT_488658 [Phyllosticta citrichinensis]|uniref:Uncharacterized protein n=1 Tax=Phyllosticta citrichinensis TaxID=1130410 RepID=A0ABR1XK26_9PEZI